MHRFLILIFTIFLFSLAPKKLSFKSNVLNYPKFYFYLLKNYNDKSSAGLHYALITGDKSKLSKKIKNKFKTLFLLHFLTPSGLHLGILFALIYRISKKLILFTPILFFQNGFDSAKRILLIKYLGFTNIKKIHSFFAVFIINFIFGGYSQNPLSFTLSFLFLGLIHTNKSYKSLFFSFLAAQLITCFFLDQNFSLFGFILGFLITPVLALTFPFYLTGAHFINKHLISLTISSVETLSSYAHWDLSVVSFNLIMIVLIIACPVQLYLKRYIIFLLLITHSSVAVNQNSKYHLIFPKYFEREQYVKIKKTRTGYKTTKKNGDICYHRLRNFGYLIDCKN